jgi:hypothetical protein
MTMLDIKEDDMIDNPGAFNMVSSASNKNQDNQDVDGFNASKADNIRQPANYLKSQRQTTW